MNIQSLLKSKMKINIKIIPTNKIVNLTDSNCNLPEKENISNNKNVFMTGEKIYIFNYYYFSTL